MRSAAVAFVLLAALLGACSSEAAEPAPLPPTTPPIAATPSPSPSVDVSIVPPAAQAPSPEGASAFARYWIDELNVAARSGDTTRLRALAHPACNACKNFADSIDYLYTEGGGIRGGVFSVVAAESPGDEDPNAALVSIVYNVTPTAHLAEDGSVARELPAIQSEVGDMQLVRGTTGWLLREFSNT